MVRENRVARSHLYGGAFAGAKFLHQAAKAGWSAMEANTFFNSLGAAIGPDQRALEAHTLRRHEQNMWNKRQRTASAAPLRNGGKFNRGNLSKVTVCAPLCAKKELKFIDFTASDVIPTTGEVIGQITVIPQGTTESKRVGRMAFIHSIAIEGVLKISVADAQSNPVPVRLALIRDRQCNGAAAGFDDVYNGSGVYGYPNLSNAKRFVIVKEWNRTLQPSAGVSGAGMFHSVRITDNLQVATKGNGVPIEFNNLTDDGALNTIESNNYFLVAIADTANDLVSYFLNIRVRFTD